MSAIATAKDPAALKAAVETWKKEGLSVGFVPTMGALHAGHLSLVRLALEKAGRCVVSIYVNPTQFAPHEDFDSYPRTEAEDIKELEAAAAHLVYLPRTDDMYPGGMETDIKAGEAAKGLETDFRPHFFDGVVNVVYRLFEHVQPDIAVFGEKDFQQLQVIREMVTARSLPIEIVGGPLIRDEHGLALSSRNAYLSPEELKTARALNVILNGAKQALHENPDGAKKILSEGVKKLEEAGFDKVDYLETRWNRILAAAHIGKTRLIDNMPL